MKIYELAPTPSAKRVTIFLTEKGIDIERVKVDLRGGENLSEAFRVKSVNGRIPVLELEDGTTICESIAICRYFEALYPEKTPLFGTTPLQQAQVEMWQRVVELQGLFVAFQAFRNITGIYKDREHCIESWGNESRQRLLAFLPELEKQVATHPFIAGEHFSVADITAFVMVGFIEKLDIHLGDGFPHLQHWRARIAQRPSVQSL